MRLRAAARPFPAFVRRLPALVRVLALLVVAATLAGRAGAASPALPGAFRVVQFNVRFDFESDGPNRWANRVELVAGLIRDARASVACLQEDKANQVDDLRRALPGWEFVGAGRDGRGSERCSVAFDGARWRCVEHGDFWLSDTPEVVASSTWGCKYPHKVTWARLEDRQNPRLGPVTFLSTHLDEHPEAAEVRRRSAEVIRAWLGQHARGANLVVCGDFNAGTTEAAHAAMLESAPAPTLQDAWEAAHASDPSTGTVHNFTGHSGKKRIDWIFIGGHVTAGEVKIDRWNRGGRYPSDHFAVVGELSAGAAASGGGGAGAGRAGAATAAPPAAAGRDPDPAAPASGWQVK